MHAQEALSTSLVPAGTVILCYVPVRTSDVGLSWSDCQSHRQASTLALSVINLPIIFISFFPVLPYILVVYVCRNSFYYRLGVAVTGVGFVVTWVYLTHHIAIASEQKKKMQKAN